MKIRLTVLIISFAYSILGFASEEYICFSNPEYKDEMLCYNHLLHPKKDEVALTATVSLFKSIDKPRDLIKLDGEMSQQYSKESFLKSLAKHYSGLTKEDILLTISTNKHTAVYLRNDSTLYFSHDDNAFIFSYDSPIALVGAEKYFGHGHKPKLTQIDLKLSLCNLKNQGVLFLSPQRESFHYTKDHSYCSYNGMAYINKNQEIYTWPINQLGKTGGTNQYVNFSSFLMWLKNGS
jgi:hypothetical protein